MERFVKIFNGFEIFDSVLNTPLISDNLPQVFRNDMKISRKSGLGAENRGAGTGGRINLIA